MKSFKVLYKKIRAFVVFFLLVFSMTYSQSKVDCNTLFVCISQADYQQLFTTSYFKDSIFLCKEITTTTTTDTYTGKYCIGEFATLEFFQPSENKKFGENLNDLGIEFKTRKEGDLVLIKNKITSKQYFVDKVFLDEVDQKFLWYSVLKQKKNPTNFEISILEYSPEYLRTLGFTLEEIKQEITPTAYNKVVYNNVKYPRKFKSIQSITVEVNRKGLKYLKKLAKVMHYKISKHAINCLGFTINYIRNKNTPNTLLKNIEINLTEQLIAKNVAISPNIMLTIKDKTANLKFNY